MSRRANRYKRMERNMTAVLIADLILFIVFLFAAGFGVIWLKVITAIVAICTAGLCLGFLYLSQELLRRRSLWMSVAAAAILVCTVFALIFNYPSPSLI